MAKKQDNVNPLGLIRRSIWYVLRAVLIVSLVLVVAYAAFTEGMYISNMYIIVTEGMSQRAQTVLMNGSASELTQFFTEQYLSHDKLLLERPYLDYAVDSYDYRYEIKGVSVLPWTTSGSITYEERIPSINGSVISDDITEPMPSWTSVIYRIGLVKVDGRWLIDSLSVVEENPEGEVLPTPDYSQLEGDS